MKYSTPFILDSFDRLFVYHLGGYRVRAPGHWDLLSSEVLTPEEYRLLNSVDEDIEILILQEVVNMVKYLTFR